MTSTCDFPLTLESHILADLWLKAQSEYLRETDYMAELAGIEASFDFKQTSDSVSYRKPYLELKLKAYNDNIERYLQHVFKYFRDFEVEEEFFKNLCDKKHRAFKNQLAEEPYERLNEVRDQVIFGDWTSQDRI